MSTLGRTPQATMHWKPPPSTPSWKLDGIYLIGCEFPRIPSLCPTHLQRAPLLLVDHQDQELGMNMWPTLQRLAALPVNSVNGPRVPPLLACRAPPSQFSPIMTHAHWDSDGSHLAYGAHGSHVALISGAELWWCEQACRVQAVQASVDGDFTHGPQVTVTPDLEFGWVFIGDPGRDQWEEGFAECHWRSWRNHSTGAVRSCGCCPWCSTLNTRTNNIDVLLLKCHSETQENNLFFSFHSCFLLS